jgi:hypothetical protein
MRQAHVFYNAYNYLRNSDQILNYHLEHWFSNFLKIKPSSKTTLVRARRQWLTPVILATQEAEIRRIVVQSPPRQRVWQDPISKNPS